MSLPLPELVALLGPHDRAVLLAAYRAGAGCDRSVPPKKIAAILSDQTLPHFDSAIQRLAAQPFWLVANHGTDDIFLTQLAFPAIRRLLVTEIERPVPTHPEIPFTPDNPRQRPFTIDKTFADDVKRLWRDGNLRVPLQKKFQDALNEPERSKILGKGSPYRGCHSDHVARNFRIVYRFREGHVTFVRFLPKDDPNYAE